MPYRYVHPSSVAGCWICWQLAGRWLLCRGIWMCHTRPYITGAVRRPSTVVSNQVRVRRHQAELWAARCRIREPGNRTRGDQAGH